MPFEKPTNENGPKWATRKNKIKANAKNRKKASKHQRRSGSKKRQKEIDLGNWKINVKGLK